MLPLRRQGGIVKWVRYYFIISSKRKARVWNICKRCLSVAHRHSAQKAKDPNKDNKLMSQSPTWAVWAESGLMVQKFPHYSCDLEQQLARRQRKIHICHRLNTYLEDLIFGVNDMMGVRCRAVCDIRIKGWRLRLEPQFFKWINASFHISKHCLIIDTIQRS